MHKDDVKIWIFILLFLVAIYYLSPYIKCKADLEKVEVVNVVGIEYEDAVKELNGLGIEVVRLEDYSNVEAGKIFRQSFGQGKVVKVGEKMTVYVSLGEKAGDDGEEKAGAEY